MTTRTATCACGQLSATCTGAPLRISLCHCNACRLRTGSAFGIAVFYDAGSVVTSGQSRVFDRLAESGFRVIHHFCPDCGATVYWLPDRLPGRVAVALGAFADQSMPAPDQQVHLETRLGWVDLPFPSK